MRRTKSGWVVVDDAETVLTREYSFSEKGKANTFVTKIPDGKLLVISPPCGITSAAHEELKEFGEVAAVVASNGFHHLGLPEWRKKYPDARFFAAMSAAQRIAKKNPSAGGLEPLSDVKELIGKSVVITEAAPTKLGEIWAYVPSGDGNIWFGSDILVNMPEAPGNFFVKMLMQLTKSAPGFKIFNFALMFTVANKKQVLHQLLMQIKDNPPTVIVPAHGSLIAYKNVANDTIAMLEAAV